MAEPPRDARRLVWGLASVAVLLGGCDDASGADGERIRPTATAVVPGEEWILIPPARVMRQSRHRCRRS